MFAPKNIIAYTVTNLPPVHDLEAALREHIFKPRGASEYSRSGWAEPAPDVFAEETLVVDSNGMLLITLKEQEADLKGSVVREALDERVALIEAEQSRKVYRKEKLQLKDEVIIDMLPRAFNKSRTTSALINSAGGYIFIDASSHAKAENLLNQLRQALGSLKVALIQTMHSADKVMTTWLQGASIPKAFALDDECMLIDPMADAGRITAKGQDLLSDEITAHIAGGYYVRRLALEWMQQFRFVLHSDLSIHRLRTVDEYRDQLDAEAPEDVQAAILADVWRWTVQLTQLTNELIAAFGGSNYQLAQETDGVAA